MPTLPNMGIITPTAGADRGTWDDKINAAFGVVDAHDHTSGNGARITSAAISIDANLSFGGFTLSSLGKLTFSTIAAPGTGSKSLFVNVDDNELYWRSNGGVNVKLTSGSSLNTSLLGGIGGDYASAGAEVAFDDSNDVYTFKDQSSPTRKWMRVAGGPLRIYEFNTTESVYLEQIVDPALASSYTVTWPAALPANTSQVRIGATGVLEFFEITDAVKMYSAHSFIMASGGTHTIGSTSVWSLASDLAGLVLPLAFSVGDALSSVDVYVNKASDATNTLAVSLYTYSITTGAITATQQTTLATNAPGVSTITLTLSPQIDIEAGKLYALVFAQSDSSPSAVDKLFGAAVTYSGVAA